MRVLFLTIGQIQSLSEKSVHIDIIKALIEKGHEVSVLCTREKRLNLPTEFVKEENINILRLKIGNLTRCSIIEKGINTLLIEKQFTKGVKKYFGKEKFDVVIYNTPPITLASVVKYCKKKFDCKAYLMLKDIFPQNAVDIGLMRKSGLSGILYKLFAKKEKDLYAVSDKIGCMSQANVDFIAKNHPDIDTNKLEIFPNAVRINDLSPVIKDKALLSKYGVNAEKLTFIYGGNLGKPQGLDFFAEAILACGDMPCNFVIVGSGQDKEKLFDKLKNQKNAYCIDYLPHKEYSMFCASCDVGMVMLDYRFTIPNYPSRVLSYMENSMPVFACTDKATDIKTLVESEAKCGKWCYSNSIDDFKSTIEWFISNKDQLKCLGDSGNKYMLDNFNTDICVDRIVRTAKTPSIKQIG